MKLSRRVSIKKGLRIMSALLLLVVFLAAPYYSGLTQSPGKVQTIEMPGLTGAANNVIYVDDRYVLAAPFAPSKSDGETEGEDIDIEELDNHFLYLIDTKKPGAKLSSTDLKTCYFPSRLSYDAESRTVFIRGTEFYKDKNGEDASREVIVHVHLNLDENGKPFFDPDPPVAIPIKGHTEDYSEDAPTDFVLGHKGKILVYTNGKSIFTYNVITGDLYPVHFGDDSVTLLDIDEESNTLFVSIAPQKKEGVTPRYSSEIRFYKLRDDGFVDLIKLVKEREDGTSIKVVSGSNAALITTLDSVTGEHRADLAFFTDKDGSLCQVDLRTGGTDGIAESVGYFPDLDQMDSESPSPRIISYDRAKRTLSIVKRGTVWEIRRPTFNRPRRIRRPTFLRVTEPAAIVLVQLNKKFKVVRNNSFNEMFAESGGLSNQVIEGDRIIVAGFDGKLYSVDLDESLDQTAPRFIGEVGDRVEFIASRGSSTVFVAINSFETSENGQSMITPGSVSVARLGSTNTQLASSIVSTLLHAETLARSLGRRIELAR